MKRFKLPTNTTQAAAIQQTGESVEPATIFNEMRFDSFEMEPEFLSLIC
jgi:hypothetical protein